MKYIIPTISLFTCIECNRTIFVVKYVLFFRYRYLFISKLWPKDHVVLGQSRPIGSNILHQLAFLHAEKE